MTTLDVYRALWRRKAFIVVLTSALVAAAWYFTSRQTPIYEASTLVRIQERIDDPGEAFGALQTGERLAATYAEIAETREISDRVGEYVASPPEDVEISAEAIRDIELLKISARSADPEGAALVANAAPIALRTFIGDTGTLHDQIVTVDRAIVPEDPVSPNVKLNTALALLLGVILNGALALLAELLSDRLPEAHELEKMIGRPVLATIPVLKLGPITASPRVGDESVLHAVNGGRTASRIRTRSNRVP